jgi:hypothetical protein
MYKIITPKIGNMRCIASCILGAAACVKNNPNELMDATFSIHRCSRMFLAAEHCNFEHLLKIKQ